MWESGAGQSESGAQGNPSLGLRDLNLELWEILLLSGTGRSEVENTRKAANLNQHDQTRQPNRARQPNRTRPITTKTPQNQTSDHHQNSIINPLS